MTVASDVGWEKGMELLKNHRGGQTWPRLCSHYGPRLGRSSVGSPQHREEGAGGQMSKLGRQCGLRVETINMSLTCRDYPSFRSRCAVAYSLSQ